MAQQSLQQFKDKLKSRIIDSNFPQVTQGGLEDFINKIAEEIDAHIKSHQVDLPSSPHGATTVNVE